MSQVAAAVDGASVKRRRLLRKTCKAEVVLPTGAVPVAPHARRGADAQMSAGAATRLSAARRGMYKAFFVRQKKLMQAPPSLLGLGSSPTNNFAYAVWLRAKVLVVCTNRWGLELETPPAADHEWLLTNAVVVRVDEPLFLS